MSSHDDTLEKAVTRLQAMFRGRQVRQHYRVSSVPGAPGIIHTRVSGTSAHFSRVGMDVEQRRIQHGPASGGEHVRTMDILSIDRRRYAGGVAGGDTLSTAPEKAAHAAGSSGRPTAFINASYFNYGDARNRDEPEFRPIGRTRAGGADVPSLPVPAAYASDYTTLHFQDSGDLLTAGPMLSGRKSGFMKFGSKANAPLFSPSGKAKYNYRDKHDQVYPTSAIPGYLHHAGDPNARAAFVFPATGSADDDTGARQDRVRMMTITPNTGREAGFTMAEMSQATTRVNSWNTHTGMALNLDGGGSVSMGVMNPDGTMSVKAGYSDRGGNYSARPLSTIIKYTGKG